MGIIRNFVNIVGITPPEELPSEVNGQIVEYSEVESIFIPINKPKVKSIYQIIINIKIKSKRIINSPLADIVVIDGVKKINIIYTEDGSTDRATVVELDLPYNTFFELPKEQKGGGSVNIYIVDAYFSLLDSRKIYSHILYLVEVYYNSENIKYEVTKATHVTEEDMSVIYNMSEKQQENVTKVINNVLITKEDFEETPLSELIDIDSEYI
jgi:hypothetical protein